MPSVGSPPPMGPGLGHRVRQAQVEVQNKVAEVKDQLQQVQQEGETQVTHLKENYEREALAENSREETLLASEKLKGYENLRDLQRTQAAEMARVKREGEADLSRLSTYYREAAYGAEQRGDEQLHQTQSHNQKRIDYETKTGEATAEQIKREEKMELDRLQTDRDFRVTTLEKQAHEAYEKKRNETNEAITKSSEQMDSNFQEVTRTHQETMGRLNNRTYAELQKARLDGSRKLAAFNERQEDPFYQLLDMQAELADHGDKYVLTARIPEHEQHHVSVAVRGNQIVLSGSRRNEEKVELEPGHTRGTNAYQSFMESFPVGQPVEASKLSHEFDGDQVIVTVPKKLIASEYKAHKAKPNRVAVAKPDFPEHLPHVKDETTTPGEVPARQGSGPLVKE